MPVPWQLPTVPTLFQNIRILDPVAMTDRTGALLLVGGTLHLLSQAPLGTQAEKRAIALPDDIAQSLSIQNLKTDDIETVDAQGWIAAPGLVDLYSHSGEPGFESRETAATLAQSALAGGFTRLGILPNTQPVLDHPGAIARLHQTFTNLDASPSVYFWGALTQGLQGTQMTELGELATLGDRLSLAGFADGVPLDNPTLLHRLLDYGRTLNQPIVLYPQSPALVDGGVAREGRVATQLGLSQQMAIAETIALSLILDCVAATQTPVHIMRVSTAGSVALIQAAKDRGLPVTASTTWMHLLFNTDALSSYDPNLRIEPPLGNPTDQAALLQGLNSGVLDAIAIDHSPHTYEEKTVPFALAPPGVIGLQCALPLLWQGLVEPDYLTALQLWQMLSRNPAQCLGQQPPTLSSEFVIFDPAQEWTVTPQALWSRSHNFPGLHQTLCGQVLYAHAATA
ncbi:MAG: dihydroorotase [Cyanothece sp. SIO2G6]|nr:dihydroorotase [Cyanothece sp. SIO2G6]